MVNIVQPYIGYSLSLTEISLFKMVHLSILIIWIMACLLISSFLKFAIVRQIHSKPLLHSTVIDLSYADCFVLLYLFEVIFALSDILCLTSETAALSFELSFALSIIIYFILCTCLWSLTVTGTLRLVSLVTGSEETGIQSFGPDHLAIWMIRLISLTLSAILMLSGIMIFNSIPIFFYMLYIPEHTPISEIYQQDPFIRIYLIPLIFAAMANAAPRVYCIFISRKIFGHVDDKFMLSLENVLAFPLVILMLGLSQFHDRYTSLAISYPFILMFSSVIIPALIVLKNEQTKKLLLDLWPRNAGETRPLMKMRHLKVNPVT